MGPKSNESFFYDTSVGWGEDTLRHRQKKEGENGGRHWNDALTSQGMSASHQKQIERCGAESSSGPLKGTILANT